MESLGLSQTDAQFKNKWRRIKGSTGSPGEMAVKTECVCGFKNLVADFCNWLSRISVVSSRKIAGHILDIELVL